MRMLKLTDVYSNTSQKDLYHMISKGILLQDGKVCLSQGSNGEINETVSATKFSYGNHSCHKWISLKKSRKLSSKLMYVNLKYQMGSETLHAYFATCGDEWMMIELCRFIPHKKDVDFEVLLESLSRYYCGSGAIYVEGIHFQAIDDATLKVKPEVDEKLKGVERVLKLILDSVQQVSVDYDEITHLEDDEKFFSLSKANEKKCHMLPAKMVLHESSNVKCYNWKSLAEPESRLTYNC
ncbi:hypothetical protein HanPI659440_Chr16g0628491 [Helianthus annuus]|nr:hypothetical protein HanPI659440_Chr16g0628491 [Helianthus annuus]